MPLEPDLGSGLSDALTQRVPADQPDLGDMRAHDIALSHLNARGFIQFHPLLAQRLYDFKAAIFLGHALYWSKHLARIQPHRKGWFFMSAAQWTQATGLSTREQASIRSALVARGLLLEALAGRPAVMHFKVDLDATARLLGQPDLTWASMTELFRSCIRFYKPLADICGSVGAGLYLSYLLQRQSFAMRNPPAQGSAVAMFPGEFVYRPEQARIALCLGSKTQRNAREKLKAAGFIREGRSIQEVVTTRVNLAAIASCLQAQGERSIRKSAPRRGPVRAAARDLELVPHAQTGLLVAASMLQRTATDLPQRQLHLFSPVGVIAQCRFAGLADDRLAPQDDAATLVGTSAAARATPARLVMSLFAPATLERAQPQETAAIENGSVSTGCSTEALASSEQSALLSNPICRFVDPNLPFCRNYKEQGIPRYFLATTTPPVDNSTPVETGRRRIETAQARRQEPAVDQGFGVAGSGMSGAGALEREVEAGGPRSGTSPGGHESPSARSVVPFGDGVDGLILPKQLEASLHAGVLAAASQAPTELRQSFLDELAGHLAIPGKTIHNPAGWLHSLVRRHAEGFVSLAMAAQIADMRARQRRHQERLAGSVARSSSPDAAGNSRVQEGATAATDSEVKRVNRQRLLELKVAFTSQRGGR
jgi:hypothetical protein